MPKTKKKSPAKPREGWDEAFSRMHQHDPAFKTKIEAAYADYLAHGGISGEALLAKLKRKRADRKDSEKLLKRLR